MTGSKENYLKTIYKLGGQFKQVSNKDISHAMNISASSVTEMIKKLLEDGFVEYELYQGVQLTKTGIEEAIKVVRRHLLWEVFLVDKLGYKWDEVDEVAELLEHVTDKNLEDKLDQYLDYPNTCPHGTRILKLNEEVIIYRSLDTLSVGDSGIIRRFEDIKEVLNYVDKLGLKMGDKIEVLNLAPYNGPITLKLGNKDIVIGKEAANKIYIE